MNAQSYKTFRLGIWVLSQMMNRTRNYGFFGDLEELFHQKVRELGLFRAKIWFSLQILRTFPPFLFNQMSWCLVMFGNYWKITWRGFRRHKGYSFINIFGLAVGMASCFLILLWVSDELSFDRFHVKSDRLYRVEADVAYEGGTNHVQMSPVPLVPILDQNIPEIKKASRCTRFGGIQLGFEKNIFYEDNIRAVDPSFFEMFSFPLMEGSPQTVLAEPFSIILTEKSARKYFGEDNPIGRVMQVENQFELIVTGIVQNTPDNSTITFDALVRFDFVKNQLERMPGGWGNAVSSFVELVSTADPQVVAPKITHLVQNQDAALKSTYSLNPLSRIHLHFRFGRRGTVGLIQYVVIFTFVAVFILAIACINFMNLSTARSANRAREIGMRKVVGARRSSVLRQFFGESVILAFWAMVLALILVVVFLPVFNRLSFKEFTVSRLADPVMILGMLGITLLTGLMSGSYPALLLSSFQPVKVLRTSNGGIKGRGVLRKGLVLVQFSLSILLITGTFFVHKQVRFMKNADLGYARSNRIVVRMGGESPVSFTALKNELLKNPGILGVTATGRRPTMVADTGENIDWEGKDSKTNVRVVFNSVDYDFLKVLDIPLIEGRSFSKEFGLDRKKAFLINEKLARKIGENKAVGRRFQIFHLEGKIIGVFQDYHHLPLRWDIEPMVLLMAPNPYWLSFMTVWITPENTKDVLTFIRETWKKIMLGFPFSFSFLDEEFDRLYRLEERLGGLLNAFAVLAVLIACLGLFGLASFSVQQRTREIGIRKVIGAGTARLTARLTGEFMLWALLSNAVAWPAAWFILKSWLKNFAYRTDLNLHGFLIAGILAALIALLTVVFQTFRAARAEPVKALRYE